MEPENPGQFVPDQGPGEDAAADLTQRPRFRPFTAAERAEFETWNAWYDQTYLEPIRRKHGRPLEPRRQL